MPAQKTAKSPYQYVRKGIFIPQNPRKYKGDYTNIVFRSSWEKKFMVWLDTNSNVKCWSSEEVVIPYRDPLRKHPRRYFVDFYVEMITKENELKKYLIEIKPKYQTKEPEKKKGVTRAYINEVVTFGVNQAKWQAAEEYCKKRGWIFKVMTEDDLGIK